MTWCIARELPRSSRAQDKEMRSTYGSPRPRVAYRVERACLEPDGDNFLGNENEEEAADGGEESVVGPEERSELEGGLVLHVPSHGEDGGEVADEGGDDLGSVGQRGDARDVGLEVGGEAEGRGEHAQQGVGDVHHRGRRRRRESGSKNKTVTVTSRLSNQHPLCGTSAFLYIPLRHWAHAVVCASFASPKSLSKHILNAQVSVRAPCCQKWFDCPECHAEVSDHPLRKTLEMAFICKKCKKAFRKDMTAYEESDEYCPHCDNHYVRAILLPYELHL